MIEQTKLWYKDVATQYELIKQLYNREFCLLVPKHCSEEMQKRNTRTWRAHNTQSFMAILNNINYFDNEQQYNFYTSIAQYKGGVPMQTFNLSRRKELNAEWNRTQHDYIEHYPFFIDVDSPTHEEIMLAHESVLQITKDLDADKFQYEVRFSGCGFHIIIHDFMRAEKTYSFNPEDDHNIYEYYRTMAESFQDKYTEMIDTTIYDSRRVIKMPYTLALYEHDTYVCWSFNSRTELENFQLENYTLRHFISNDKQRQIYKRGLQIFNKP